MNNKNKAIILTLLGALFATLSLAMIKFDKTLPIYEDSFFRNLVILITPLIILRKNKGKFITEKKNIPILILRTLFGTLGVWCSYYAINHMLLANATTISGLSPVFALIFAAIFLKEKTKPIHYVMFIFSFIGIIFIVNPSAALSKSFLPELLALLAAVFSAGVATTLRKLGKKENPNAIIFFYSTASMLMSVPFFIYKFEIPTLTQFLILVLSGLFSTGTQICTTKAFILAPAREISIFKYSNIIFSTIIGFLAFGSIPSKLAFIGYLFIILSATILYIYNSYNDKRTQSKTT